MVSLGLCNVSAVSMLYICANTNTLLSIGDWFPERNLFQLLVALTSPLRFSLVFLSFYLNHSTTLFLAGLVRTLSCGGWVYITSSDDHDVHDAMMVLYIVCNLPFMLGGAWVTRNAAVKRNRWAVASWCVSHLVLTYKTRLTRSK
jgi:hypothetical protein